MFQPPNSCFVHNNARNKRFSLNEYHFAITAQFNENYVLFFILTSLKIPLWYFMNIPKFFQSIYI